MFNFAKFGELTGCIILLTLLEFYVTTHSSSVGLRTLSLLPHQDDKHHGSTEV